MAGSTVYHRLWMYAAMAAPIWVLCGCQPGAGSQEIRLIASARPYEADIPVPSGFVLVDKASEDQSTGVSRLYLRHIYRGGANKHAVRTFYRDQMPLARWHRVSDGNVRGSITMVFEKGVESCTIDIGDAEDGLRTSTQVQILVHQVEREPASNQTQRQRNGT